MAKLNNKKILLGITGSIAAYKDYEIVRALIKEGAAIKVVMSKNATRFVSPLTLETLTGNPITVDLFEKGSDKLAHINLSAWADIFLIAPATANFIGKTASGIADDVITSTFLVFEGKTIIAPAMNNHMWGNPIVQNNALKLREIGVEYAGPGKGFLACGDSGEGRLADIGDILFAVEKAFVNKPASTGKKILITAGPTREFIDDVRFLSNPSTGKMGSALARAFALHGADVVLVSGATETPSIPGVEIIQVTSASDMAEAVFKKANEANIIIMTAAVADWKPEKEPGKIKKGNKKTWKLELTRTKDILSELGRQKGDKFIMGFAVETENEIQNAKTKLKNKNLDLIFVNNPLVEETTFAANTNAGFLISKDSQVTIERLDKEELSMFIVETIRKMTA
ncbi:bifunctional phosphopantothenoylcysteine decarboxylase/phosphopantothenate--cysteine ligase CoaBC [bacterium]|nr:bifunctional phosphopantothenoylcysteine decarboxylase/phosphopantothenate--cysteine ligase CoaBC [bacterium]